MGNQLLWKTDGPIRKSLVHQTPGLEANLKKFHPINLKMLGSSLHHPPKKHSKSEIKNTSEATHQKKIFFNLSYTCIQFKEFNKICQGKTETPH